MRAYTVNKCIRWRIIDSTDSNIINYGNRKIGQKVVYKVLGQGKDTTPALAYRKSPPPLPCPFKKEVKG